MYNHTAKLAFLMRVVWFFMIFFNFPLVIHFLRSGVLKLIFGIDIVQDSSQKTLRKPIKKRTWAICTVVIVSIPFLFAILYPHVAYILANVGAVCGCILVYFLPVLTYLMKLKGDSDNPVLSHIVEMKWDYLNQKLYSLRYNNSRSSRENGG